MLLASSSLVVRYYLDATGTSHAREAHIARGKTHLCACRDMFDKAKWTSRRLVSVCITKSWRG
jgi:hypothetical protein